MKLSKALEIIAPLVKGGKRAIIGEIRMFAGREYIKTNDGWKFHGKGTGKKTQEHRQGAGNSEKTPEHKINEAFKRVYDANGCTDVKDCDDNIAEVNKLLKYAEEHGVKNVSKLQMRLASLTKKKEKLQLKDAVSKVDEFKKVEEVKDKVLNHSIKPLKVEGKLTGHTITKQLEKHPELWEKQTEQYAKLAEEMKEDLPEDKFPKTYYSHIRLGLEYDTSAIYLNNLLRGKRFSNKNNVRLINEKGEREILPYKDHYTKVNKYLSELLDHSKLPREITLYRGITGDHLSNVKIGDSIDEPGFTSTSTNIYHIPRFAIGGETSKRTNDHIILKIKAPKGTKALPIQSINEARKDLGVNNVNEIVLQKDTKFKVTGFSQVELIDGIKSKVVEVTIE